MHTAAWELEDEVGEAAGKRQHNQSGLLGRDQRRDNRVQSGLHPGSYST